MGQAHRLEQRPVERDDRARGHGEGEADLAVEGEQVGAGSGRGVVGRLRVGCEAMVEV